MEHRGYTGEVYFIQKAGLFRPFFGGGAMLNFGSVHILKLTYIIPDNMVARGDDPFLLGLGLFSGC